MRSYNHRSNKHISKSVLATLSGVTYIVGELFLPLSQIYIAPIERYDRKCKFKLAFTNVITTLKSSIPP